MGIRDASRSAALAHTGWNITNPAEAAVALWIARAGKMPHDAEWQYRVDGYKLDFAWPSCKIALEVDGPMHFAPHQAAADRLRDHRLRSLGWLIFHVDADEPMAGDQLAEQVIRVLAVVRAARNEPTRNGGAV